MLRKGILTEDQLEKYADVLVWGLTTARKTTGGKFEKGDIVQIRYDLEAIGLLKPLYKKLLKKGFNVFCFADVIPEMEKDIFEISTDEQLKFIPPWSKARCKSINGSIFLSAPTSLTHLEKIDPKRFSIVSLASKPLRKILKKREENGKYGWTLCTVPTSALAKKAGLSFEKYSEQIVKACYLDVSDPIGTWKNLRIKVEKIKKFLNELPIDYLNIQSVNTNLNVKVGDKRKWLGMSGHNIPSFEIFTSPDWRGTNGIYFANVPSFKDGNYVEGVKLVFKNGEVVEVAAKKGEEFVKKQLSADKGAKRVGELSFTDSRFSRITKFMADILYDENIGGRNGNCHIAIGDSYSDTYNGDAKDLNTRTKKELGYNDSCLHWDLINTESKKVIAHLKNGKEIVIYKNGMFVF